MEMDQLELLRGAASSRRPLGSITNNGLTEVQGARASLAAIPNRAPSGAIWDSLLVDCENVQVWGGLVPVSHNNDGPEGHRGFRSLSYQEYQGNGNGSCPSNIQVGRNQTSTSTNTNTGNNTIPLWQRRGAKPIPALKLDPLIRCDGWRKKMETELMEPLLELVRTEEWVVSKDRIEAHRIEDIDDGLVINPTVYPAHYTVDRSGKTVAAQLPYCLDILIRKALQCGYDMKTFIKKMGVAVADYSRSCIQPQKRDSQRILVLAGPGYQGAAALYAAFRLRAMKMKVKVYAHDLPAGSEEELAYISTGGTVYRDLNVLKAKRFRAAIVAVENQNNGGRLTKLPLFGDLLQHTVAIFVNPPVLKGSYINALQFSCLGAYNVCRRTVIFVPSLPIAYVQDDFTDIMVVDIGIAPVIHLQCGVEYFSFRQYFQDHPTQLIHPQKVNSKGSKLYFYDNGMQVV